MLRIPARPRFPVHRFHFWILLVTLMVVQPLQASDIRLVLANDFLASNRLDDDLYTGALVIDFDSGKNRIQFGENIFTDRENGLRFDETWISLERPLRHRGLWRSWVEVGVVHVGEGLLGESVHNALHRLIGDEEVHLEYVDVDKFHPTFRLRFERDLLFVQRVDLVAAADLYGAADFKQHVAVTVKARYPRYYNATFFGELGARYSASQLEVLDRRIADFAPTWEAGVLLYEQVSLSWNYNHFGTKAQHFNVVYHLPWGKKRDRAWPRG